MSYDKTSWTGATALITARIRNLETQHEKLLVDARVANNPLLVEIDSAGTDAALIQLDTGDGKLKGYNGTAWVQLSV